MFGAVFYLQAKDILEETRGIKCVLDQFQKEKTSEMDTYLKMFSKDYTNTYKNV